MQARQAISRYYDGALKSDDSLLPCETRNVCLRSLDDGSAPGSAPPNTASAGVLYKSTPDGLLKCWTLNDGLAPGTAPFNFLSADVELSQGLSLPNMVTRRGGMPDQHAPANAFLWHCHGVGGAVCDLVCWKGLPESYVPSPGPAPYMLALHGCKHVAPFLSTHQNRHCSAMQPEWLSAQQVQLLWPCWCQQGVLGV